jgi:hypothetical protein
MDYGRDKVPKPAMVAYHSGERALIACAAVRVCVCTAVSSDRFWCIARIDTSVCHARVRGLACYGALATCACKLTSLALTHSGTVCISWPTSAENRYFDVHTWPKLFQGIYLILGMQAYADALCLSSPHGSMTAVMVSREANVSSCM